MQWKWLKKYLRQLKLYLFFNFPVTSFLRKLFKPYSKLSYAQTGEDRIIVELLKDVENGFYVDVGAYHPVIFSNTYFLYKKGWKGINIDANQASIDNFERFRPRDRNIQAVVSDEVHQANLVTFEDSAVSSIEKENIEKWTGKKEIRHQKTIMTQTLGDIFEKNDVPRDFELLSIDVEGHDYEALASFDINTYRPKLIVIEMHDFDFQNLNENKIYRYLTTNGYRFVGYVIMNGYFLSNVV